MINQTLKHYKEFKEALARYHISDRANDALSDLKLVVLVAASASGRNTIIRHLVDQGGYHYIISDTTRAPRINDGVVEQNGEEYWFRTEQEVLLDLKKGEYLEAELIHNQQVSGISIRELEQAKAEGKIAIADTDLQGINTIRKAKPDTVTIMVLPPSFDEWQRRITRRGRMSTQEYVRRLHTAHRIFEDGINKDFYKFVISENVEQSISIINSIVQGSSNPHQDRAEDLIRTLQEQLEQKLESYK
jgi:guanylate kinase